MIDLLARAPFFKNVAKDDIRLTLKTLSAAEKTYKKGEIVMQSGTQTRRFGIVLRGKVCIEYADIWGNLAILGTIGPGSNFAVPYACLENEPLPFAVTAQEDSAALFIDAAVLMSCAALPCRIHAVLLRNLIAVCARRNLHLAQRALHTAPKTIQGRLMAYLSDCMRAALSTSVTVPYNRQQLAQYLGVDRSALSGAISKMQKDGILTCHKNTFALCSPNGGDDMQ